MCQLLHDLTIYSAIVDVYLKKKSKIINNKNSTKNNQI